MQTRDLMQLMLLELISLTCVICTGDSIWAVHHAPEFHVGEVLGGPSGALLDASAGSAAGGHPAVVLGSVDPLLRPTQLGHRIPLHELLRVHHPLYRIHHRLLDTNCTGGT